MSDPEVSSGVGAFATAFADVVRATDPSLRQIAGTPSSSHPLPPPPPAAPPATAASAQRLPPFPPPPPPPPPPQPNVAQAFAAIPAPPPPPPPPPAAPLPQHQVAPAFAPPPAAIPAPRPEAWAPAAPPPTSRESIEAEAEAEATVLTPRSRAARAPSWTLTLSDGMTFAVTGATVIGRRPTPPALHADAATLALPRHTHSSRSKRMRSGSPTSTPRTAPTSFPATAPRAPSRHMSDAVCCPARLCRSGSCLFGSTGREAVRPG